MFSALQTQYYQGQITYEIPNFQRAGATAVVPCRAGVGTGALEHVREMERSTKKTAFSDPTLKCPDNLNLKLGKRSGRDGCREASFPGKDTEKALWKDVEMKGQKDKLERGGAGTWPSHRDRGPLLLFFNSIMHEWTHSPHWLSYTWKRSCQTYCVQRVRGESRGWNSPSDYRKDTKSGQASPPNWYPREIIFKSLQL